MIDDVSPKASRSNCCNNVVSEGMIVVVAAKKNVLCQPCIFNMNYKFYVLNFLFIMLIFF